MPPVQFDNTTEAPNLPREPWQFVLHFIGHFKIPVTLIILCEIGQKSCQILIPYVFKELMDGAIEYNGPQDQLFTHLESPFSYFVAISVGILLFSRASGALTVWIAPKLRAITRSKLYHYLQFHSHRYFISNFAGSLANRINEVSVAVNHGMWTVLFDFLPVAASFSVSAFLLWNTHTGLAFWLLVWVSVYVVISFLLATKSQLYSKDFAAARSKTTGHIVDAMTNVMNTKLFSKLGFERNRLHTQLNAEVKKANRALWYFEKMRWFQFTAGLVLQVGAIAYALVLFQQGAISVGSLAMVATLALMIIEDSRGLSRRFLEFFEYLGNVSDGVRILIQPHELVDANDAKKLAVSSGRIEFDNVKFSYKEGKKVFDGLNVTIQPREKVGLVGYSGSGKTTFANLILRMFDVTGGAVKIDGQAIASCTQDSLRDQVSMIPQEPMLFHRTLLENLRYGRPDATEEMVYKSAQLTNSHDFILETEKGYDSLVGERGVKLSGGQRQRVAITRAIIKDAPILIMDEATSSLDSVTEKTIQDTLDHLMSDKTVIVIAHRLSTISHLDRILVFDDGRIVEDGKHDELILRPGGAYAKLWGMQAGGFLPSQRPSDARL